MNRNQKVTLSLISLAVVTAVTGALGIVACKPRRSVRNSALQSTPSSDGSGQEMASETPSMLSHPTFLYHGLVLNAAKGVVENPSDIELENLVRATGGNTDQLAMVIRDDPNRQLALAEGDGDAYV